ncbi:MAG: hypothetical protein Q4D57_01400 [Clostridia bacterium]|nr:hypothetical protein [Clostridia bacterium]
MSDIGIGIDWDEDDDEDEGDELVHVEKAEEEEDVFDDMEDESKSKSESEQEYDQNLGHLGNFFKKIRKKIEESKIGEGVSFVKGAINGLVNKAHIKKAEFRDSIKEKLFGSDEEETEVLENSRSVGDDDNKFEINEELKNKDILFNSMQLKALVAEQRLEKQKEEKETEKAKQSGYVVGAVLENLDKLKHERKRLEEELKEIDEQEKAINEDTEIDEDEKKEQLAEKQKERAEKNKALEKYTPDAMASSLAKDSEGNIANAIKRRAAQRRAEDTEERKKLGLKERYEGYDYEKKVLDEELKEAKDAESKKILEQYRENRQAQQDKERGVVTGITQALSNFEKTRGEEKKIVAAAEGKDKEILQSEFDKNYSDKVADERAVAVALERAEKEAEYLRAQDDPANEEENKGKDYVEIALTNAAKKAAFTKLNQKLRVLAIIEKAKQKHSEDKQKAEASEKIRKEEEKKRKAEQLKAEAEKYDEKARIDKALAEKRSKRKEIEAAKNAEGVTPGMAAYYDEQMKKIDSEMAEITLQTKKDVASDNRERYEKGQQELKAKLDKQRRQLEEEKAKKDKEISDAREKAKKKLEEEAQKKEGQVNQQPGTNTGSTSTTGNTNGDEINVEYDDAVSLFLKKIGWGDGTDGKALEPELARLNDDDYDDDEEEQKKVQETEARCARIRKKFEAGMKAIRSLNDMKKVITARSNAIREAIDKDPDPTITRKDRKYRLGVMDNLISEIGGHFNFHGPSIAGEEARGNKGSLTHIIELSALLNDLDTSLFKANSQLGEPYNDDVGKMISDLHAESFRKFGTQYLKSLKVTNSRGKQVYLFSESSSDWRHRLSGSQKTDANSSGKVYMGILRTIINVCNAHTWLDSRATGLLKNLTSDCQSILDNDKPQQMSDDSVTQSFKNKIKPHMQNYNDSIQKLENGNTDDKADKNISNLARILKFAEDLSEDPNDAKTREKIEKGLKSIIGDFSSLDPGGTGCGDWNNAVGFGNELYKIGLWTPFTPKQ